MSVPQVFVPEEKKSPLLRRYQSFSNSPSFNGKVFTSTTAWKLINLIFFFQKSSKLNFDLYFWPMPRSWNHLSFVNISPTLVIDTSMERSSRDLQHVNPKIWFFSKNVRNWILSVARERKSPWLRQYQSYISNWCINGKFFTGTTAWKPKNLIFFSKKFEIEFWLVFWLVLKSW